MQETDTNPALPGWHHTPDVPIEVSPFFSWPPNPKRMATWLAVRWLNLAENLLVLGIALICWKWLSPSA